MKVLIYLLLLISSFQFPLILHAKFVDFEDYAPVGSFIHSGSSTFDHWSITKGRLRLSPYIPTGLERGEVHNELMKSTIALNKICENQSSPYYEVLEYKTIEHTKRLANGQNIMMPRFWANVRNVGNAECVGWTLVKGTSIDISYGVEKMFTRAYGAHEDYAGDVCPIGWKIGRTLLQKGNGNSAEAVYRNTFECFAAIGSKIPQDFFCKGYGYGGYQQLYDIHKKAQEGGVLTCTFGREAFDNSKMEDAESRLKLQKSSTQTAPTVAPPVYSNCTPKFYRCESDCKRQMNSQYCIDICAERFCEN